LRGPVDIVEAAKQIARIFNSATAKFGKEGQSREQGSVASATKH